MGNWIHKHRNLLLIALLSLTMAVSYLSNQRRMQEVTPTVSLPVVEVSTAPTSALEQFREERDAAALRDMSALETLVDQSALDDQTRADAAAQLQRLIDHRQKQTALEAALLTSDIAPCVAVVDEGSVTIVTEKETLTEGETALLLTMVETHASVLPSGVRVVTAGSHADAAQK